jgi:23S rRNA (pseudouridine1915-N3)-methyltransferase
MKILILSTGKSHESFVAEGVQEFTSRIARYAPVEWKLLPTGHDAKEEATSILKALDEKDFVVLLDERGKELSSPELAQFLEKRLNASTQKLVFVIGGAFGVSEEVVTRAHFTWSLSKLVFPHQLVRLILSEQLYRAYTILRGEKYHHS